MNTSPDLLVEPLTPAETRVLALVAEAFSTKQIAKNLGVSPHTVNCHIRHAMFKLDTQSRWAAVLRARERGWLGGA